MSHFRRWLPWFLAMAIVATIVGGAVWVLPASSRNPLTETLVWSLLVLTSFVGWGSLVRLAVAPRTPVDLGLRAAWGMSLVCLLGAVLMIPSWMTRTTAMLLVEVGVLLALLSVVRERAAVSHSTRYAFRVAAREPGLTLVALVVAGIVVVRFLGAIADWHINPYDDELAYLAFAKKLSDTGAALEPFSLRRIAAYGGQTLFTEILSVRAAPTQAFAFDRGVAFLLTIALILGHRAGGRRPTYLALLLTVALVAMQQNGTINTASYFSGAAVFVALFRTLVWAGSVDPTRARSPWRNAVPLALLSAAACSLRQNYLPVPVITLAVAYGYRAFTPSLPLRSRWLEPTLVSALTLVFLLPWFVTSWQSSGTILYPVLAGYSNPALSMTASAWNMVRELAFQTRAILEERHFRTLGLFIVAAALINEREARRTVWAMALGALGGFVALSHGFTMTDPLHIGRYAFGFMVAFPVALLLTLGTYRLDAVVGRAQAAIAIAAFALFTQLLLSRDAMWWDFSEIYQNVEELHYSGTRAPGTEPPERALYERVQNAVPAGERIAVMADEPYHLDFRRNTIFNLDMPCFASLPPGMPCLQGAEAIEGYFRTIGLRYVVFVESAYSRYQYRRDFALELFVHKDEIWRLYAPYLIDFIDSLEKMKTRHRTLYSERGIVVLDLAGGP